MTGKRWTNRQPERQQIFGYLKFRGKEMEEEEIRQLWAEGEDWVIKLCNNEYFYRPDGKYGEWKRGLPTGVLATDVATLFDN